MELKGKSDYQLVNIIKKKNDSDAYLELKRRHEKLYYSTAASYCRKVKQLDYNNLIQDIDIVLLKSINTFNRKKKCKISSYFCNMSRYHILNTIKSLTELGHYIPTENSGIDLINNQNFNFTLDKTGDTREYVEKLLAKIKDKRTIDIIRLRFYGDKKSSRWAEISKKMGISIQHCTNLMNNAKKILYKEIIKNKI